jgi:hypothetical protein
MFVGHFSSYYKAHKKLNIKGNRTISRLIDTGKTYKVQGFNFFSVKPSNPTEKSYL